MRRIDEQKHNIDVLLSLIRDNPDVIIMPMVDSECCPGDDFRWWAGSWGKARLDECWQKDERCYIKSEDYDEIYDDLYDDMTPSLSNEEADQSIKDAIEKLPWKKVILVSINPA